MAGLYLPHDLDAVTDDKIVEMLGALDWYGYGLYWRLLELLYTRTDHKLTCNYKGLSKIIGCDADTLQRLVTEFGLFTLADNGSQFWSERVLTHCEALATAKQDVTTAKRKAASARWDKSRVNAESMQSDAQGMQVQCTCNAPAKQSDAEGMQSDAKYNINLNNNLNLNNTSCGEQTSLPPAESYAEQPKITHFNIILNDKSLYDVTEQELQEWRGLYPAVDVEQELRNMHGWADANPKQRKTRAGIRRFITAWLSKAQDKARCNNVSKSAYTGASVTFDDDNPMYRRD